MIERCYNCAKYISAKKKNDYIIIPADGEYLPYKKYNGCKMLRVYLNTNNINKQESEETQLKTRGCSNWLKDEKFYQLSIFDFIEG